MLHPVATVLAPVPKSPNMERRGVEGPMDFEYQNPQFDATSPWAQAQITKPQQPPSTIAASTTATARAATTSGMFFPISYTDGVVSLQLRSQFQRDAIVEPPC